MYKKLFNDFLTDNNNTVSSELPEHISVIDLNTDNQTEHIQVGGVIHTMTKNGDNISFPNGLPTDDGEYTISNKTKNAERNYGIRGLIKSLEISAEVPDRLLLISVLKELLRKLDD